MSLADAIEAVAANSDCAPLVELMERRQQLQRKPPGKKKAAAAAATADATPATDDLEQQVRELPAETLDKLYPEAIRLSAVADTEQEHLEALEALAQLATVLVDTKDAAISPSRVFAIAQNLHGQLLRLRGDPEIVPRVQDAIAMLCESCWKRNFHNAAHSLVTQLLPYLIVRSYECPPSGSFTSRKHPVRRLFAIKDALELLDFDDESSGLLRDILLRCYIQPNLFRSPDAIPFLSFLFELHLPFISDINDTIRNQIPHQRRSILTKYGAIYFKAWVHSTGAAREALERDCIQRFVTDAVHARTATLFSAVRSVLQSFVDNKRHVGVDEMLFRLCSPILWRGIRAANDSVRRQAAVLMFDAFPLRDPQFTNEQMDLTLQRQFDAFEELLSDSHPAVRIAAVQGVSKVLSVYWELLPAETIRCFVAKLVVDLVHDAASSSVRAAVFEGLQFILDNHNAHAILKPLLPMLAPLINDRNERVRAEFAALLVRIKSIRNLHFYDVVSVDALLTRLVLDRDCIAVRRQLVALFLNSYFPQSVGGSSQVARCLALVKKHPDAAIVFYGAVADTHASVGSVCKLAALLLRCSLNFVSRRLHATDGTSRERSSSSSSSSSNRKATRTNGEDDDDDEEEENDDSGFSVLGQIVVLEVITALLRSVHDRMMHDPRYAECRAFVAEQLPAESIAALLVAYSGGRALDDEAQSAVWKLVGFLGELGESALLEQLVAQLTAMDESSSKRLLESIVNCLAAWQQLPLLVSKLVRFLHQWKDTLLLNAADANAKAAAPASAAFALNPVVVLGAVEYIASAVTCPPELLDQLFVALQRCVAPVLELDATQLLALYRAHSFRLLQLLEVFAKFTVLVASARVHHRAAAALTARGATKRLQRSASRDLLALQPSALFEPPEALAALSQWVTRLLPALRDRVHDENVTNLTGKRRRSQKKRSAKDEEDADDSDASSSPLQQLLARWRNLFSLIALLSAECVAFAFEHENVAAGSAATDFIDGCVDDIVEALEPAAAEATAPSTTERLERVVFYQGCQLLFLLRSLAAARTTTKQMKTKSSDATETLSDVQKLLAHWIARLHDALERAHGQHEADVDDLWTTLAASEQLQQTKSIAPSIVS